MPEFIAGTATPGPCSVAVAGGGPSRARAPSGAGRFLRAAPLVLILGLLPVACATRSPDAAPAASAARPGGDTDYRIGPGDTLNVFVYRAPELSVTALPVRPDGRISLPLVPDLAAAGKTPTALAHDIEGRLRQYVREPNVTVMVQNFVGPFDRQIRVIGEATEPQAIPYREHMTVLDVMIATKGLTRFAAGNRAVIARRDPDGAQHSVHVRLSDLIKDGNISENVEMRPGDTLIIPQSWF